VPQIRSVFFVTTILPLTHATSVTTSISLHGPEHEELLDELGVLLDDSDELLDIDDTLDADELEGVVLLDELLLLLELVQPPRIHHLP